MTLKERIKQFKAGLITKQELESFIDLENMGSDMHTYAIHYSSLCGAVLVVDGKVEL